MRSDIKTGSFHLMSHFLCRNPMCVSLSGGPPNQPINLTQMEWPDLHVYQRDFGSFISPLHAALDREAVGIGTVG